MEPQFSLYCFRSASRYRPPEAPILDFKFWHSSCLEKLLYFEAIRALVEYIFDFLLVFILEDSRRNNILPVIFLQMHLREVNLYRI